MLSTKSEAAADQGPAEMMGGCAHLLSSPLRRGGGGGWGVPDMPVFQWEEPAETPGFYTLPGRSERQLCGEPGLKQQTLVLVREEQTRRVSEGSWRSPQGLTLCWGAQLRGRDAGGSELNFAHTELVPFHHNIYGPSS